MRLKNLLNYFDTLNEEEPCGRITFSRFCNKNFLNSNKITQVTFFVKVNKYDLSNKITQQCFYCIEYDFSNKITEVTFKNKLNIISQIDFLRQLLRLSFLYLNVIYHPKSLIRNQSGKFRKLNFL
jgi:hypothetical protein